MTLTTARLDELALLYPADTDPLNAAVIEAARESVARQECEALLPEDAFLRCGHALITGSPFSPPSPRSPRRSSHDPRPARQPRPALPGLRRGLAPRAGPALGRTVKPREEGLFINGWTGCGCFLLILLPIFLVGVGFGMAAVR